MRIRFENIRYIFMNRPKSSGSLNTDAIKLIISINVWYVSFRFKIFGIGFSKRLGKRGPIPTLYLNIGGFFKLRVNIISADVIPPFTL